MSSLPLHVVTPLLYSQRLAIQTGKQVHLKIEALQPSASFKLRGIGRLCQCYAEDGFEQLVASSGGNAGISVAYCGKMLGMPTTVFIPSTSHQIFIDEIKTYGAQVIVAQTNNADFGYSEESVQQLAIARLRAIESGRTVVNISTVGVSAIIRPDGTIQSSLPAHQRGAMTQDVTLSSSSTPAMVIGRSVEVLVSALGAIGFLMCFSWRKARRQDRDANANKPVAP